MLNPLKYHHTDEQMKDELKIILLAQQDISKFDLLYHKYYEQIFRFVYQRLDDKESAFDITSQVFLNAISNIHKYEFRGVPFSSWLYRIAINELNNAFRKNSSLRTINLNTAGLKEMMDDVEEDSMEDYLPTLTEAISNLPENDLQLIEMRFFQQLSFKQIADITETTEGSTKMKIYRILEKLKNKLVRTYHHSI
jgi:RNA polymerase sigma-70 factor (ECF subfamily)